MTAFHRTLAKLACTASVVLAASASLHADIGFFESFDTGLHAHPGASAAGQTLNLASGDWYAVNHSTTVGTSTGVFAGDLGVFAPYNGSSYAAFNYNMTSGAGTISAWLITPEFNFTAGDTVSFYTRTVDNPSYADRLVVRASDNGASLDIGTGPSGVGDFDIVLGTVNPSLTTSGYPNAYTQFTYNVPFTGSGRIAFQYYVTNGGPSGSNSDYIGIDAVSIGATPVAAVPEPSSFAALAGLAGLALAASRRRRSVAA